MSSDIVRQAVYDAWATKTPALRLEKVENRDLPRNPPLALPDVWATLVFTVNSRRPASMGKRPWIEETGIVNICVQAKSGHGDAAAIATARTVQTAWQQFQSADGMVEFTAVGAPNQILEEVEGEWVVYGVPCTYSAQERPS